MWRSNIRIALRSLIKHKFYAGVSILGLAASIAFAVLMVAYVHNESTFDSYHDRSDNIFRIVFDNYEDLGAFATTPLPIGPALLKDYPELESMTRISNGYNSLVRFKNNKFFETISFVDSGLVDVFSLHFIHGDPSTVLKEPNQVILSESTAQKYFGEDNPIGKMLEIGSTGVLNSEVVGVFRDFPQNSHISLDLAAPFSTFEKTWGISNTELWLQMPSNYTYVRLFEGQDIGDFSSKLPAFAEAYVGGEIADPGKSYVMNVQQIEDIHLNSHLQREAGPNNDLSNLYMLGFIALLILLVAAINYINHSTARFSQRAREVVIRKVVGATRKQLVLQFLSETLLIVTLAAVTALVIAQLLIPIFNEISGKTFTDVDLRKTMIVMCLGLIVFLLTLLSGIFPALFLSSFRPIEVLKGKFSRFAIPEISRKYLVTIQFTTSIILIIATLVVSSQMDFARKLFQPDHDEKVVLFQTNGKINNKMNVLKEELLREPGILSVTASSNIPTFYGDSWPIRTSVEGSPVQTENYAVDDDFIQTLGFELVAGRDIYKERATDVEEAFILNQTAVRKLGIANAQEAIDQAIYWGSDQKKKGRIVGVVEDFHFQSLHNVVEPAIIQFSPFNWMTYNFCALRIQVDQYEQIEKKVEELLSDIDPKWIADIRFLDDNFEKMHEKDIRQGNLFGSFALLAIIISSLGLLGLIAFATERRTKEIGIRKVLGCSIPGVVGHLTKDFFILVLVAFMLAVPISYAWMSHWLKGFAYSVELSWWQFAAAGIGLTLLVGITVSYMSIKAALVNPVKSLRSE